MGNDPVPLREALREAVVAFSRAAWDLGLSDGRQGNSDDALARAKASEKRVYFLIEQIPIVFEARESDG